MRVLSAGSCLGELHSGNTRGGFRKEEIKEKGGRKECIFEPATSVHNTPLSYFQRIGVEMGCAFMGFLHPWMSAALVSIVSLALSLHCSYSEETKPTIALQVFASQ